MHTEVVFILIVFLLLGVYSTTSDVENSDDTVEHSVVTIEHSDGTVQHSVVAVEHSNVTVEYSNNEFSDGTIPLMSKRPGGDGIASCALRSKGLIAHFISKTIIFDVVVRNNGNGYNESTGVYTVPKTGEYILWFDTWDGENMDRIYFAINRLFQGGMSHGSRVNVYPSGLENTSTTRQLNKGDLVWVVFQGNKINAPPEGHGSVEFCAYFRK